MKTELPPPMPEDFDSNHQEWDWPIAYSALVALFLTAFAAFAIWRGWLF